MTDKAERISIDRTLLRYIVVGLISTLTHYLVFVGMYRGVGLSVALSTILGFVASWCVAYGLNYKYTFKSQLTHGPTMLRYAAVTAFGLALNVAIMTMLVERLDVHYNVAFLIMSGVVFASNYLLSRKFVF